MQVPKGERPPRIPGRVSCCRDPSPAPRGAGLCGWALPCLVLFYPRGWEAQAGRQRPRRRGKRCHPTFLQRDLHHDPVVGLGRAGGGGGAFQAEGAAAVLGHAGAGAQGAAQWGGQEAAQGVGRRQAGSHCEGQEPFLGLLKGRDRVL